MATNSFMKIHCHQMDVQVRGLPEAPDGQSKFTLFKITNSGRLSICGKTRTILLELFSRSGWIPNRFEAEMTCTILF